MSWAGRTAVDIAAAVREGRVTPREVVAEHLERIERLDGGIHAYRTVLTARALEEADALASRPGLDRLPLAGVPVAVKDNVPVRGEALRNGSAATPDTPADEDHPAVRRLREAGAVVVGLTHVPELCVFGTTDGPYGVTRNPWDPGHTSGGSSGGSAAAVASGTVPLALGADGMGSLRIPAACCGLIGFKPGWGVVPAELGGSNWFGLAENGPLATTAADAALMFSVLAGRTPVDPAAAPAPAAPARIAVSTRSPLVGVPVTKPYAAAARGAAGLLAGAGHRVESDDPPYPVWLGAAALAHWTAGTAEDAEGLDPQLLTPRTRRHAAVGRFAARTPLLGNGTRERLRERLAPFFARYDALVLPALARRAPAAEPWHTRSWLRNLASNTFFSPFTPVWNLAGWPALALPFGTLPGGAPCSVQLVAPPGGEDLLLGLATAIESGRPWERTAPQP
ncbi:amidase [Streptomyces meridianus]|uniref:Amidase family protein n=1 Tax=Streptomyces meridianus TaxID=2938945 RepID=A0ABT0X2M9_9ACTN|nr:amidase family protein [Streptomyces meridianus]MCM2576792.1 amidase family protein [Streptomyces meridianus]